MVSSRRIRLKSGCPWSCRVKSGLHEREGKALTNFPRALPSPNLDMAEQILKDPYNFDFLTATATAREREIERGLLTHLRDFLLELGRGFSFVGSQVPVTVDEQTFYIDLLFYHVRLHRYFVFELKVGAFQPEHAGKLSFYLAAVNRTMSTSVEGPSIGFSCARAGAVLWWNLLLRTPISRLACPPIKSLVSCRRPCRRSCRA
jgi:predicted nuclease of restriction endonuclease-like (RecB) superfamily